MSERGLSAEPPSRGAVPLAVGEREEDGPALPETSTVMLVEAV